MSSVQEGVIYFATGQKWIDEACASVATLKRHMPRLPVTLFCDRLEVPGAFDRIVRVDHTPKVHRNKIVSMRCSPYERTIFLDTDTYVASDLSDLFRLLDRFDIAMAHCIGRQVRLMAGVPPSFPELNTGVIAYRKNAAVAQLLDRCLEIFDEGEREGRPHRFDQPPMRQALYESTVRLATLPPEYNCQIRQMGCVTNKVSIVHGRNIDLQRAASEVNAAVGARVFFNGFARTLRVKRYRFYLMKAHTAMFILWRHGLRRVVEETRGFMEERRRERALP